MSDTIANILMQIGGKSDEGDKVLDTFGGKVEAFGKIEATAKADVNVSGGAKLDELIVKLNAVARESVMAKVQVQVDQTRLDKALAAVRELNNPSASNALSNAQPSFIPGRFEGATGIQPIPGLSEVGPELEKDDVRARSFFDRLRSGFNDSSGRSTLFGRTVEKLGNAFDDVVTKGQALAPTLSAANEAAQAASKGIAGALDAIGGRSGVIGGSTSALAKVFESLGSLGPAAILPIIGLLAILVAGVNALIATLVALGGSLTAAVAGIVALGAAFVAALGPAVLLAIGVFKELSQIIQVVTAQNSKTSTAAKTLTTDIRNQKDAQVALGEAQKNVAVQASAAAQAQRDAVLAVADAYDQVREAQLGIPEAKTALEAADLALSQFKANLGSAGLTIGGLQKLPTDVAVSGLTGSQQGGTGSGTDPKAAQIQFQQLQEARAQALLGVKESQDRLNDSTNNYAKAQQTSNNFTKEGALAYAPYVSALKQVTSAQEALTKATAAVNTSSGKSADGVSTLSKAGQKLVPVFTSIYKALNLFQPAIDAVLGGLNLGIQGVVPLFKALASSFTALGGTMGLALAQIGLTLSSPAFTAVFKGFIADSGRLIQVVTPGFIALLKIFTDIAKDAMPALITLLGRLSTVFEGVAKHPKDIASAVNLAVKSFLTWFSLIGHVVVVLGQLAGLAAPIGNGLVKQVTVLVEKFSAFLNTAKGRAEVIAWIKDGVAAFINMIKLIKDLIVFIRPFLAVLVRIGAVILSVLANSKSLRKGIEQVFETLPVLTFYNLVKSILGLFESVYNQIKKIIDLIPNLGGIAKAINPFQKGGIFSTHAAGGVTTGPSVGVIGEAGPEAILPLTSQVYAQLGASIAPVVVNNLGKLARSSGGNQHNEFHIKSPPGTAPDTNTMMAQIEQRLSAIGAA